MDEPTFKGKIILEKIKTFFKKLVSPIRWILIIALGIGIGGIILYFVIGWPSGNNSFSDGSDKYINEDCTVTGINLHGTVMTYIPEHAEGDPSVDYDVVASENVLWSIQNANANPDIKAIVVEVDSVGGSPVAGEEIADAIKNSDKPVIAFIRDIGASSAYWSISSASRIWASKNSDVGSIGVTMSYLNNAENNKKEGYAYEQLSSGKFKDSGSPDMSLTKEEKDLFMRDVNIIYENFVKAVSDNRKIPIEEVKKFADGSTVLGEKAKELGLIDEIGGINEVEKYLEGVIGEKLEICWE
ncbi:MAG: signal peptide peptidase SppA [Candidatus Paceibacterota bacterium]